ncbi:MAG: hypothetical protein IPH07_29920 [Deltaproteobacteria bacterium]|nr:hypothetical protein [Deltaproteobacteria bacterium]MBK8234403.1 hypothetical protein [Deltaproteobacteria bacterium]MBK8715130.1 hypothetical protein [Deltaproteobacteria bacterium]MBP7285162.1 hypothetical protein [Nannocystaceae bacterium]
MTRVAASTVLLFALACDADERDRPMLVGPDPSGAPIASLSTQWRTRFDLGDTAFELAYRPAQGLGPLYVRTACASCHADDAKGPGFVTKMSAPDDAPLPWGDTARPYTGGGATTPIAPGEGVRTATRIGPAVFGRGYMEAIDVAELERVAAEQAAVGDRIHGRIHRVSWHSAANPDARFHDAAPGDDALVGRFGLKASIATLDDFAAGALVGDMSITSPMRPDELANPDGITDDELPGVDDRLETVNLLADYVRMLEIPSRVDDDAQRARGRALFAEVGCARCHVPSLRTAASWPLPQLADIDAPIYSDLLLHDMGEALADGVREGDAGPRDWRTAPLMGLRHLRSYLHDGRTDDLDDAIVAHGDPDSEAFDVVTDYLALPDDDRDDLLAFVGSL